MSQFKAIATITWRLEADSPQECLALAREQLEKIVDCAPFGDEYEGFCVQLDIAAMKEKKRLLHIASYPVDEILAHVTEQDSKKEFVVDGQSYLVRMNSDRYLVFKNSRACVSCGIEGTQMVLDINPGDQSPHFNLYAEDNGRLVLMTKDHIIPKSKGGLDAQENYATMCCVCNNLKGAYHLDTEGCRKLREVYKNEAKLPRKELRELINKIRNDLTTLKES